jgi:hypothetical protein
MPQYQGVWTVEQQAQALTNQQWVTDPNFRNTTLLLQADGTGSGSQNQTFLDGSTNNFFITRNGNTTQGSFSPFSQAPGYWSNYFNGSSDYLTWSGTTFGSGAWTIECWFNITGFATNQTLIGTGTSGTNALAIYFDTATTIRIDQVNVSSDSFTVSPISTNAWHHFVAVKDGSNNLTLFIDGVRASTGSITSARNYSVASVRIGFTQGGAYWPGYISNFRAVVGTAVYSPTSTTLVVPNTPLTAITNTQLLTCQNNRFLDNSTNAYALTATGTPSVQGFGPFAPALQWTPDVVGGSGYYDGSGDYLNAGTNTAFNIFNQTNATVEFWIYLNAAYSSDIDPICYYQGSNDFWMVQLAGGQAGKSIRFYTILGGSAVTLDVVQSSTTFQPFQWNHCAFVKSGSNWYTFINGAQVATAATAPTRSYTTGTLNIGCRTSGVNLLNGYLGGLRITNTVVYSGSTYTVPSVPLTAISGTQILLNNTNAGIYDGKMANNLETVGNAQVSTSPVKYGSGSMYFSGVSPYSYLKSDSNLARNVAFGTGDFTIECWVWLTTTASDSVIMDTRPGSNSGNYFLFYLWTNGGAQQPTIAWYVPTSYALSTGGSVSANVWTHIAVSRANGIIRSFKDGVLQQSAANTTSYANPGAPYPYIGASYGVSTDSFKGYIDDFRITNGVARYIANFTPPQQALPRQ